MDGAADPAAPHYVGAVEAVRRVRRPDRRAAGRRRRATAWMTDPRRLFDSAPPPIRLRVRLRRGEMLTLLRRARRRPGPSGQAEPARPAAVAGPRPGRAVLEVAVSGRAGPAGTSSARRSPSTASAGVSTSRAAAGPDLPAPRDVRRARRGAHRRVPRSPGATRMPGWWAWTARRCPSAAATWSSLQAARQEPTGRSGSRSWPTTTGRTGTDRRGARRPPSAAGPLAGCHDALGRPERRFGAGDRPSPLPRTWTPSAPWPRSTAGWTAR